VGYKEVGRLSLDDSISLLSKIIYGEICLSPQNAREGKKIAETLGCFALAITHARAYIRETFCLFYKYLKFYERRRTNLF
jgi:hypothetical protein